MLDPRLRDPSLPSRNIDLIDSQRVTQLALSQTEMLGTSLLYAFGYYH